MIQKKTIEAKAIDMFKPTIEMYIRTTLLVVSWIILVITTNLSRIGVVIIKN
jgi:hypothetical protein